MDKSKVFIVHGHDNEMKQEVARFIEKLGLEPIILHEQASKGNTIIEKIEEHTNVGFGIVLYSSCDVGGKSENDLRPRARQNVVFEHGYLIAKLKRQNVTALVKGTIETPGDISGVVYISMSSSWEVSIAQELDSAGYKIDFNKLFKK
jgi:predicted nucleotide-binding protein